MLLWGVNDPWITMNRANKMLALLPSASFRPLQVYEWCRVREKPYTLIPEP